MLNKFALKELEMIRLIAEKGREQDAYAAARRFIGKAGDDQGAKDARIRAVAAFLPRVDRMVAGRSENGSDVLSKP